MGTRCRSLLQSPGPCAPNPAISGAVCPPILQPSGPCAPQSCNLRGRMPPVSAIPGALPPPTCPSTCPRSSPCGLLAPPVPPHPTVVVPGASVPLPCLPYSISLGVIPQPIQSRRASFPRPSSVVGQSPPTHPVSRRIRALPVATGASWAPLSFRRRGGVRSLWHRCASPSISGRGFVGPWGGVRSTWHQCAAPPTFSLAEV